MLSLMIVAYSQIVFSPIQLYSTVPSMCFQKHSKTSIVWGLWANGLKLTPWHPRVFFPLHRPEIAVKSEQWEKLNSHPLQQRRRLICFPPQFSSKQKKYKQREEEGNCRRGGERRKEKAWRSFPASTSHNAERPQQGWCHWRVSKEARSLPCKTKEKKVIFQISL